MSYLPSYDDSSLFLGEQQPVIPRDPKIPDDPTIVGPGRYDIPTTVGSNLPLSTMPNQPKATMSKKYPNSEEIIRIRKSDEPSPNTYFQKSDISSMGSQKLSTKATSPSYRQSKTTNADRIKTYNPGLTEKDNELMEGPEATRYSPEEPLFDERYKGESKIHSKSPRYSLRDPYPYQSPPPYPGPQDYEIMDQSSYPRSPTFRMTGRPLTPKKLMDNPGPGAYSPKLEKESRSPKPPKFVITYKPFIDYDNKVPGPCYYQYEHTIRSGLPFSQKYSMHIRPPPPKKSDVPGPGTYDPDTYQWISPKKPSPKIGNGNRTDFVTHAWTPGPGSYFPTEPYSPKSPSSTRRRSRSTRTSPRQPKSARSTIDDQQMMNESNNSGNNSSLPHSPISARKFIPSTEKKGFSMGTSPRFPKVTGTWQMK